MVELKSSGSDFVVTDKNLISTVFRNLISNAIKFSNHNSKIVISISANSDTTKVSIQDFGVGINEEDVKKIFNVDYNISKRGTDGEEGTGLGLIICSEIIKKLDGEISVISKVGEGSTFIVELTKI